MASRAGNGSVDLSILYPPLLTSISEKCFRTNPALTSDRTVDLIPQKIGVLNEILKGREVFSNVGQMAPSSSLTRFASARDDGMTKLLVWGIMSDVSGRLVVTLRDFRPHVVMLHQLNRPDLAQLLAQDYLDDYAYGVNALARRVYCVFAFQ